LFILSLFAENVPLWSAHKLEVIHATQQSVSLASQSLFSNLFKPHFFLFISRNLIDSFVGQ